MPNTDEFDFALAYTADDWSPGIAWRVTHYEEVADEDTEWSGIYVKTGNVVAHMIGDDRNHVFDPDDLTPIADEDYCSCCGQVGCQWG